jgi:NAD(P)-dependent dehydrogenase (short-subunit alcohol dehydrogenase family)
VPRSRRILITGCSRGIGHHTALALARDGWTVVATLRSEAGQAELEAAGVQVVYLDVVDRVRVERVVAQVTEQHGGLDALVANAGVGLFGCFEDLHPDQVQAVMAVNFFGTLHVARACLPHLRASQGRLVAISSVAGRRSAPGSSLYNASKFALEGWAEGLRFELAPFGVPVVLIQPGPTGTGFPTAKGTGKAAGTGPYAAITARLEALQAEAFERPEPVGTVVDAVRHALTDPDPRFRIATGRDTRAQILAHRFLPWRAWEALVRRKLDLPQD